MLCAQSEMHNCIQQKAWNKTKLPVSCFFSLDLQGYVNLICIISKRNVARSHLKDRKFRAFKFLGGKRDDNTDYIRNVQGGGWVDAGHLIERGNTVSLWQLDG